MVSLRLRIAFVFAASAASALCACGNAEDRQMKELSEGISSVQSDADKFDQRLSSLDKKDGEDHVKPTATNSPPRKMAHVNAEENPENAQNQMAEAQAGIDDTDEPSPRPVIRVQGTTRGKGKNEPQFIEETLPDEDAHAVNANGAGPSITSHASPSSALDPEAKRAYDAALTLVNTKQYSAALDAFASFLVRWPDHPYADNATYWRGECYFAQGEFARASEQFEGVIARFPLGNKVPDAWLKIGLAQQKLGNPQKSKAAFDKLIRDYPNSEAARRLPNQRTEKP